MGKKRPLPEGSTRPSRAERLAARQAEFGGSLRAFEGRTDEPDWVALREIVPSATATLKLKDAKYADTTVILGTVLPGTFPVMKRDDGTVLIGLQTPQRGVDLSRDYAAALIAGLETPTGEAVPVLGPPAADTPRLQDLLEDGAVEITCHAGFGWWLAEEPEEGSPAAEAMAAANEDVVPTERLTSVTAAYWCRINDKAHLRWARPEEEEALLDAMARLKAAGTLDVGEGSKFVGSFRALGILVPVWDVDLESSAASLEEPAAALDKRLAAALAETAPLTSDERRARSEILSRQLTLR